MKSATINDAIIEVFRKEKKPLRVKEIFLQIKEDDLYDFNTSTPEQVVRTALRRHSESASFASSSKNKLYTTLPDGTYWLIGKKIPGFPKFDIIAPDSHNLEGLVDRHQKYTFAFKQYLLSRLKIMKYDAFERFCKELLIAYGFKNVHVTKVSKDGGLDGYGDLKMGLAYLKVAFECKRYDNKTIGRPQLNQFRGDIAGEYHHGIYFTTSKFTKEAKDVSFKPGAIPIILIDGQEIVNIMIEKKLGVEIEQLLPIYSESIDLVINN
jgi:restriction system protein